MPPLSRRRMRCCRLVVVLLAVVLPVVPAYAEAPAPTAQRSIQCPGNVQIHLSTSQGTLSDDDALTALEQAAQQLRARRAAAVEYVPPPPALLGPAVPCPPPGLDSCTVSLLPRTLLWDPPLANQSQPRSYVKPTDLRTADTFRTIDTAIGTQLGLFRVEGGRLGDLVVQQDAFAVVFSRWSDRSKAVGVDYRYGFPLTFAWGPLHGKLGYEHTSTHLGDDLIRRSFELGAPRFKYPYVRDELVVGLGCWFWDQLRVYGQFGYAFYVTAPDSESPERFNWGVEWSKRRNTGWRGQPFAAFDMDLRPEQEYDPNVTFQVGWQWKDVAYRVSTRVALEVYDGRSPFGQLLLDRERWVGLGVFVDF